MLGFLTERRLKEILDEQEQKFNLKLRGTGNKNSVIKLVNETVTFEEIINKVAERFEPMIKKRLEDVVKSLDTDALSDKVYDNLDLEVVENRLADLLVEKVFEDLKSDKEDLINTLSEQLLENHVDTDDIVSQVAEAVTDRLQISLSKDDG